MAVKRGTLRFHLNFFVHTRIQRVNVKYWSAHLAPTPSLPAWLLFSAHLVSDANNRPTYRHQMNKSKVAPRADQTTDEPMSCTFVVARRCHESQTQMNKSMLEQQLGESTSKKGIPNFPRLGIGYERDGATQVNKCGHRRNRWSSPLSLTRFASDVSFFGFCFYVFPTQSERRRRAH